MVFSVGGVVTLIRGDGVGGVCGVIFAGRRKQKDRIDSCLLGESLGRMHTFLLTVVRWRLALGYVMMAI
jgi:hypothetical protein